MKRLIRYFSGRSVIKDISAYGYDFSMKKYILAITTGLLVIFGISMISVSYTHLCGKVCD